MSDYLRRSLLSLSLAVGLALTPLFPMLAAPEIIPERASRPAPATLAVLALEAKGQVSAEVASILTDRLRVLLLQQGNYQIMERTQMTAILKEQGFQSSMLDCTSTDCALELGKLLSVRYLLIGSTSQLGQVYTLNARLIDAQSGQIIQERFVDCRCSLEELLTTQVPRLASQLSKPDQHTPPVYTQSLPPAELKNPVAASLLNIPGPLGYLYLEEWGWMGAMLAIDTIAVLMLAFNNWAWPGADAMSWLILGATRIFGIFHAPGLAGDHNTAAARLSDLPSPQESPGSSLPLLAWRLEF